MIALYDSETEQPVGLITLEQFRFLANQLEEESATDQDYYIGQETLAVLEQAGADSVLLSILQSVLAGREGMELRFEREEEDHY